METKSTFWTDMLNAPGPVLDTAGRVNEVLFGLIMVLTFTGTISVATQGRAEIATVLWGALGCNVAWGLIDGLFFLLGTLMTRGEGLQVAREVRRAASDEEADALIRNSLNPLMAAIVGKEQISWLRSELAKLPEPPRRAFLTARDLRGAVGIFTLVFLSTFPPVLPFIFLAKEAAALRISNLIALVLLFIAGYILGTKTRWYPLLVGLGMMFFGSLLVSFTIAMGG